MTRRYRRRRKLIKPGLQLRLSARFLGLAVLMLGLQYVLLTALLQRVATGLPSDHALLLGASPGLALQLVGWSAAVFLPLTLLVGVVGSFRIAGPLFRFDAFLRSVHAGDAPEDIRLRKGDELKDLAALLNDATRPLRARGASTDLAQDGADRSPKAAA